MASCEICGDCKPIEPKGPGLVIHRPEPQGAVTEGEETGAPTGPEEVR